MSVSPQGGGGLCGPVVLLLIYVCIYLSLTCIIIASLTSSQLPSKPDDKVQNCRYSCTTALSLSLCLSLVDADHGFTVAGTISVSTSRSAVCTFVKTRSLILNLKRSLPVAAAATLR